MKMKSLILRISLFILLCATPILAAVLGDSMINVQDPNYTMLKGNRVRDAGVAGDAQVLGLLASGLYGYNGVTWDRLQSTAGSLKSICSQSAAASLNATVVQSTGTNLHTVVDSGTITVTSAGATFYAIKKANLTTSSANLAFGFTSKKLIVETPVTNTDEVCIDWGGGTAICPAANTAGDDRVAPGRIITLDFQAVTSISAITASGTQTIIVRAW